MNNLKIYFFVFIISVFLNSCGGWNNFKKTMSGEKVTNTDEFLIKKKDALVLPPEYEKLPEPNSKKKESKNSVQSALGSSSKATKSPNNSALEDLILKELSKRN